MISSNIAIILDLVVLTCSGPLLYLAFETMIAYTNKEEPNIQLLVNTIIGQTMLILIYSNLLESSILKSILWLGFVIITCFLSLQTTYQSYGLDSFRNTLYALVLFISFYYKEKSFNKVFFTYMNTLGNLKRF